jgi:hypothetical protein
MTLEEAYEIIGEETKLKEGKKGLIVFDIDDTLLQADSSVMGIIIKHFTETGKWETVAREDSAQFANSKYKDVGGKPKPGYKFDYSDFRNDVRVFCPVGGFGIDGATSMMLGAALVNPEHLSYCITGDLAFFYDLNALGNRHVHKNIRILLINNGCGFEFKKSYANDYCE